MFQPPNFLEAEEIAATGAQATVILPPLTAKGYPFAVSEHDEAFDLLFQGNKNSTSTNRANAPLLGPMYAVF